MGMEVQTGIKTNPNLIKHVGTVPCPYLPETSITTSELFFLKSVNELNRNPLLVSLENVEKAEKITIRIRKEFKNPCPNSFRQYLNTLLACQLHKAYPGNEPRRSINNPKALGDFATLGDACILVGRLNFTTTHTELKSRATELYFKKMAKCIDV